MSNDSNRKTLMHPPPSFGTFKPPSLPDSNNSAGVKKNRFSKFTDEPASSSPPLNGNGGYSEKLRVSKFSSHPPAPSPPAKLDPAAAAAAAAARINASLRAKGKLSDETQQKPVIGITTSNPALSAIQVSQIKKIFDLYVAKVDINNLPISTRTYMTQVHAQEIVNKQTGAAVSTKGQYLLPEEKHAIEGIEKQLHLYIQSPSEEKVQNAVDKIKDMIAKHVPKPNLSAAPSTVKIPLLPNPIPKPPQTPQPSLPSGNYVHDKIFVGMDYVPPDFDLKTKLIGANYTNFNFVANATGAKVILRGRGSGFVEPTSGREAFESMYVFISHPNMAGVESAKQLVNNLIQHVRTEYNNHTRKSQPGFSNPQASYPATNPPYCPNQGNYQNPAQFQSYPMASIPPMPYMGYQPNPTNPYMPQTAVPPNQIQPINPIPFTPPNQPPYNPPQNQATPTSDIMPPPPVPLTPSDPTPKLPAAKKRRFKEEQPDDSNLLGYKQFTKEVDTKRTKPVFSEKTQVKVKPDQIQNEPETKNPSLPFWMSYD